ncbi:MAG: hypothetical protein H3Z52_06140 [archaeon]|nr:hypothetical protein [archaeon]MCP8320502.1 hypothetical protein [archaeon]
MNEQYTSKEAIEIIKLLSWLRFWLINGASETYKDDLKWNSYVFSDLDNILLNLQDHFLQILADEFHEKIAKPLDLHKDFQCLED